MILKVCQIREVPLCSFLRLITWFFLSCLNMLTHPLSLSLSLSLSCTAACGCTTNYHTRANMSSSSSSTTNSHSAPISCEGGTTQTWLTAFTTSCLLCEFNYCVAFLSSILHFSLGLPHSDSPYEAIIHTTHTLSLTASHHMTITWLSHDHQISHSCNHTVLCITNWDNI